MQDGRGVKISPVWVCIYNGSWFKYTKRMGGSYKRIGGTKTISGVVGSQLD